MYNFNLLSNMENNNNNNIINNPSNNNNAGNNNNNNNNSSLSKSTTNSFFQMKNNNNNNNNSSSNNNFPTMEWSNEICLRLIDEYRNFPALWDQTSPFYKNKLKRKESWCRLAERFGCSKAEVERKMNVLLTQYRREKHKMLMQVYKGELKCSRWYAFKKFSFMENGLRPKKQQRALQLLNAMQLRLGFNPLQSVQNTPSSLQNLTSWHSTSDIHNPSDNNGSSMPMSTDNEQSGTPSAQDLSINHISSGSTGQSNNSNNNNNNSLNNSIQQQTANSTCEDEMVEINVDPLTLLSGHHTLSSTALKHTNNSSNNNISNSINNARQRPSDSLNYHRDVKEEVFDSSSVDNDEPHNSEDRIIDRSYQRNQDDDDEEYSILDFRRNRYSSDTAPKKKMNFHSSADHASSFHHHLQHADASQKIIDDKPDRWSGLLPPGAATVGAASSGAATSIEKPSTTKLFQSYESQSMSLADKDDCDFIGLNVALKLRSMEESQRIIAEKLISDVLFYGQFKELDRTAIVCPKKDNTV